MHKILIGLTICICLAAVGATILYGTRTFDGTVVREPYERGLRWDAERHAREQSGWSVVMEPGEHPRGTVPLKIRISDRSGKPLQNAEVHLMVTRKETDKYDRSLRALPGTDNAYHATTDVDIAGTWSVYVEVRHGTQSATFEERLHITETR